MLEIKITEGDGYFNRSCFLCGSAFDSHVVLPCAYEDGAGIGLVCETCIASGPAGMAARMREHASHLESAAAELRRLAAGEISSATIDELQSAKDKFDAALTAEHSAEAPDPDSDKAAVSTFDMASSLPGRDGRWQVLADMAYLMDGKPAGITRCLSIALGDFPALDEPTQDFPGYAVRRLLSTLVRNLPARDEREALTDEDADIPF